MSNAINANFMIQQLASLRAQFVELFGSENGTVTSLSNEKTLQLIDQRIAEWKEKANQPLAQNEIDVDALSNFIRKIDGNNSMGAGVLAEHITGWITEQTNITQQLQLSHTINVLTNLHADITAAGYKAWNDELHGKILSYRDVLTMIDHVINDQQIQLQDEIAALTPSKIVAKTEEPPKTNNAATLEILKYLQADLSSKSASINPINPTESRYVSMVTIEQAFDETIDKVESIAILKSLFFVIRSYCTKANLDSSSYVALDDINLAFEQTMEKLKIANPQSVANNSYELVQGVVWLDGLPALVNKGQEVSFCTEKNAVRLFKEKSND